MNRFSGLLWLAMAGLLLAPSGSFAQAVTPHSTLVGVRGLEWGESTPLPRPFDEHSFQRQVAEPAVIRGLQPLHNVTSEADRSALSVEILDGFSLPRTQDVVIEVPQNILTGPVRDGLGPHLQGASGQMLVLILLISSAPEDPPAGNIPQCSRFMTAGSSPENGLAVAQVLGEPGYRVKRGPTKTGSYASRNAQHFTHSYDWLLPNFK